MSEANPLDLDNDRPIEIYVWSEEDPGQVQRALQADVSNLPFPAVVTARRIASYHLFDTGSSLDVYVKLKPLAPLAVGAGIYLAKKIVDVIADLLKERFRPKQNGVSHTIYLFGPNGDVLRCIEVRRDQRGDKDRTSNWTRRLPLFSYTVPDEEGYRRCLRCSGQGFTRPLLRTGRRPCARCGGAGKLLANANPGAAHLRGNTSAKGPRTNSSFTRVLLIAFIIALAATLILFGVINSKHTSEQKNSKSGDPGMTDLVNDALATALPEGNGENLATDASNYRIYVGMWILLSAGGALYLFLRYRRRKHVGESRTV